MLIKLYLKPNWFQGLNPLYKFCLINCWCWVVFAVEYALTQPSSIVVLLYICTFVLQSLNPSCSFLPWSNPPSLILFCPILLDLILNVITLHGLILLGLILLGLIPLGLICLGIILLCLFLLRLILFGLILLGLILLGLVLLGPILLGLILEFLYYSLV